MKLKADAATFLTIVLLGVLTWSWFDGPMAQIADAERANDVRAAARIERMKAGGRALMNAVPAPAPPDPATLPVTPWAEGHGAITGQACRDSVVNGSWGVKVFRVTSLANGGTDGSLEATIEDSVANAAYDDDWKFIFFDVAGYAETENGEVSVPGGTRCLTVAGQTAPDSGFSLKHRFEVTDTTAQALDIHYSYMRYRNIGGDRNSNGISIGDASRVYVDHWSGAYAANDMFEVNSGNPMTAVNDTVENITLAWSILGPGVDTTTAAASRRATLLKIDNDATRAGQMREVDVHHSVGYTGSNRQPWSQGGGFSYVNWYMHNRRDEAANIEAVDGGGVVQQDYINSKWTNGNLEDGTAQCWYVNTTVGSVGDTIKIYLEGNECESLTSGGSDDLDWAAVWERGTASTIDSTKYRAYLRQTAPDFDWTVYPIADLADSLSLYAGAYRMLECDGVSWRNVRDEIDANVLDSVVAKSANPGTIYNSYTAAFGQPNLGNATSGCPDLDGDGLFDDYEKAVMGSTDSTGLAPDSVAPNAGYLAIEMQLFGAAFDSAFSAGGGGFTCGTYSGQRCVYLFPVAGFNGEADTLLISDGDTFNISGQTATYDSVPHGTQARQWVTAGHDSAIVLTCEELSTADQDSAEIDALFDSWGLTGEYPWEWGTGECP